MINEKENLSKDSFIQKKQINDLKLEISKLNQNNVSLIKEKIGFENKLKKLENEEQEHITNVYLINQKMKYVESESLKKKEEINNLNIKNENLIKQIEEFKNEIFIQKNIANNKQYEIEKRLFEIKMLNSKINELTIEIDKLSKDKILFEESNKIALKNYTDQISLLNNENKELKSQNKDLNEKIKKLANISLKESKEIKSNIKSSNINKNLDDSIDYLKFFQKGSHDENNSNNRYFKNNNVKNNNDLLIKIDELNKIIKEKDLEIQRIKGENLSNEKILKNKNQELINELNEKIEKEDEIKNIVENLAKKTEEMEEQFNIEKEKIIKDYENKLSKEKEISFKLKKEIKKLIKKCSDLQIEKNRIENINELNNYNYINIPSNNKIDSYSFNNYENQIDEKDINEIKKKTYNIIDDENQNKNYKINKKEIREQTKQRINNIMNFAELNMMKNSDSNFNNTLRSNYNMDQYNNFHEDNKFEDNISIDNKELKNFLILSKLKPNEISTTKLKSLKNNNK